MNNATKSVAFERVVTERLIIEKIKSSDFTFFDKLASDQVVKKYFTQWKSANDVKEYFENEVINNDSSDNLYLLIKMQCNPIGIINLYYMANNCWLVEYALLQNYRNKGIITEVLEYIYQNPVSFLKTFYADHSCKQLWFDLSNSNLASEKVLKKISKKFHSNIRLNGIYRIINII